MIIHVPLMCAYTQSCNILEFLESELGSEEADVLDAIAATLSAADFSLVYVKLNQLNDLVQKEEFNFGDPGHKYLFRCVCTLLFDYHMHALTPLLPCMFACACACDAGH